MDDTSRPPVPGDAEGDEMDIPSVPQRGLALVAPNGDSLTEANDQAEDGQLDFKIGQVVPCQSVKMGPGSKGRTVPYFSYGLAVVCAPVTSLVSNEGKEMAILVPLPPSGMVKMTDLKKLANKHWREVRQPKMDD